LHCRWQFSLKTEAAQGLLLYNSGSGNQADLVALELDGGRVRLLLDKGDGQVELLSDVRIDDGRWHTVVAHFNPSMMEVSVDGRVSTRRLERGGSQYLDLQDIVYLGGTELNKKAHALRQGLRSADTSFRGCLRSVMVDGRRVGLPDARVSHGVRPNCVWDFVCARDPCVPGARCRQQGLSSFRCQCDQDMCVKADYADTYKVRRSPGPLGVVTEVIPSLPMYSEFVEGVFSGISDPGCGTGRAERRASHRRRERSHHHGQHPNRPRLREVRRPRCWRASSRRGNSCTRATRSRCVATGRRSNKPGAVSICGIHGNMVHFS